MTISFLQIYGGSGYPFGNHNSNKLHICQVGSDESPTITELETMGEKPPALYGQSITVDGKFLYAIGGTSGFDYSSDVYRLDLKTRVWQLLHQSQPQVIADDPAGRYRHELALYNDAIYLFGGGTANSTFDLITIPAFCLVSDKWKNVKTKPDPSLVESKGYPRPRKFHSLVHLGDLVIITGGCNDEMYFRDMWRFNLSTLEWTLLKQKLPHKLFFHDATVTREGCMYIFGGIRKQDGLRTRQLYKMWIKVPSLKATCIEAIRTYMRADPPLIDQDELAQLPMHYVNQIIQ